MAAYTASAGLITLTTILVALLTVAIYRPSELPIGESNVLLDRAVAYYLTVNLRTRGSA